MCDPTVFAIASTVAGLAGTAVNSFGQMQAQQQQKKEFNNWKMYQDQKRKEENARQDQLRGQAAAAQQGALDKISAENQKSSQADEEARLNQYLQGNTQQNTPDPASPISVADAALSGQGGGDPEFQQTLAKKIADATASSKQRIGALAKVSSYGSSSGGLEQLFSRSMQESGSAIDQANDFRRGSLGVYGQAKAVDPVQVTYQPGAFGEVAGSLLQAGSQGLGKMFAGAATPKYASAGTGSTPVMRNYGGIQYQMF